MSSPTFAETHNLVVFLEKPIESDGFKPNFDFLNVNLIKCALTVSPTIYTTCIKQFWTSAKVKTVNDDVRLQTLVYGKNVIVNEASIRCDLRLDDSEGTACLPNDAIFEGLTRIGAKNTVWNEFNSSMASAIICLANNQKFNFSKYILENMRKHKPRRKQREATEVPHTEPQAKERVPTPSYDPLPSGEDRLHLNELMDICTKLFDRVLSLEQTKTNQATEIEELKKRVKKLEGKKKKRTHGLKRLYKVGLSARVESSEDEEDQGRIKDQDLFKVHELDGDEVFVDVTTGENVEQEAITLIEIKAAKPKAKRVRYQEPIEFRTTSPPQQSQPLQAKDKGNGIMVEPEKPLKKKDQIALDEEVARKLEAKMKAEMDEEERIEKEKNEANRAIIEEWDDVQATTDANRECEEKPKETQAEVTEGSSKRAGQELEQESAKKQKLDEHEQAKVADDDTVELKRCLEIVHENDDDVAIEATPISSKSPTIVDYKSYRDGKKSYFKIIRADVNSQNYLTFRTMFKNFNKEDLEVLRNIVKERFKKTKPMDDMDNLLFQTLKTMFEHHNTGKKITTNGSDTAGNDKAKVQYFNYHKMGHFARECRVPRNQGNRTRNQETTRSIMNVEDTSSKVMVAIDGADFDWSYMADDEAPTNMAIMAFLDLEDRCKYHHRERMVNWTNHSRVNHSANTVPKAVLTKIGLKLVNTVRPVNPKSTKRANKGKAVKVLVFPHTASARTLDNGEIELNATVDGQDKTITEAFVRKHLKLANADGISTLPTVEIFKQLALMGPVQARLERLSNLPNEPPLEEGNISRSGKGSMQLLELIDIRTKLSDKDEEASLDKKDSPKLGRMIKEINKDKNVNLVKSSKQGETHEIVRHIIESDDTKVVDFSTTGPQKDDDEITLAETLVNIKKSAANDKGKAIMQESKLPKKIKKKETIQISLDEEIAQRTMKSIRKFVPMESESQIADSKAGEGSLKREDLVKLWSLVKERVHRISTRDGHIFMLEEKEYPLSRGALLMMLEFDGGYVTFGGGAKGGKITCKGIIRTADASRVLYKVPRKNNMYSVDMKNIVPKNDLTCLVAKDTNDESMLWHRRLGHINFKNINKLVKENLARATKDETSSILKIENLVDKKVKIIRCDNGAEFKNSIMNEFCKEKGIKREYSVARTPQQNSVAERRNRTLIEAARTILVDSKLPLHFRLKQLILLVMCRIDHLGKFDGKLDEGFFVGYSTNSKAFKVYNTRTRKVEENMHINFLENKPIIASDGSKWLFNIDALTELMNYVPVIADGDNKDNDGLCKESEIDNQERPNAKNSTKDVNTARPNINTSNSNINTASLIVNTVRQSNDFLGTDNDMRCLDGVEVDISNISNTYHVPTTSNTRIHKDHSLDNVIGDMQSGVQTQRMIVSTDEQGFINAIYKEKSHEDLYTCLFAYFLSQEEPKRITNALKDPAWVKAIQEELLQGLFVYRMDVKSAFLYGRIEEEVYVCQPPVFKDHDYPDEVYKVEKALYGLHQVPRAWYETLAKYLLDNGFHRGKIDQTLFIKRQKEDIFLIQVYVNDIICGFTKKELCTEFEELMPDKFQMSSMGELTFFLRFQVKQKSNGIFISHDKYVDKILRKFKYADVKPASTIIDKEKALLKDSDGDDVDVHLYRISYGSEDFHQIVDFLNASQIRKTRTRTRRMGIRIPRSDVPTSVADEAITKEMHDGLRRDTTTASGLESEQSSGGSPVQDRLGRLSNLPNEPPLGEDKVTVLENELKSTKAVYNKALITLAKRVKNLEKKLHHKRKRVVVDFLEDEEASLNREDSPK
nr:putative ribonuclease H-like domain-containing protein [Tanacetum cinerariifolium]